MTVKDFYVMLFKDFEKTLFEIRMGELLAYSSAAEQVLDRRTAAFMVHKYLQDILKEDDVADISPAFRLKDIYECRVCVPHIAQVYIKGIMTDRNLFFGVREPLTDEDAEKIKFTLALKSGIIIKNK